MKTKLTLDFWVGQTATALPLSVSLLQRYEMAHLLTDTT